MADTDLRVEEAEDFGKDAEGERARWLAEIKNAEENDKTQSWRTLARSIVKRYRDDRDKHDENARRFSLLYANVSTLQPVLYSRRPAPYAERRYGDSDPIARAAAQILERSVLGVLDSIDFDGPTRAVRDDRLLVGRGVAWLRYESDIHTDDNGDEVVTDERVAYDYVPWNEFLHNPAPRWSAVTWVARKLLLSKSAVRKHFGEDVANDISYDEKAEGASDEDTKTHPDVFLRACVWEVWDKTDRKVLWVSKGYDGRLLKKIDPPLSFQKFFPCPRPLFGITTNDSLIPVPDYVEYEGQADELDQLSQRIDLITSAIAVKGVYNAKHGSLLQLISTKSENKLVALDDWAPFSASGGLEGNIVWMPVEQMMKVLASLYESRARVKAEADEITGIADIFRGNSDPRETAKAQTIKSQYGGLRLKEHQDEMARFVRDVMEMIGEIVVEAFGDETVKAMTGAEFMMEFEAAEGAPGVTFDQALALLRDEKMRTFRINFETDALVAMDKQADQRTSAEFLTALTPFVEKAVMIGQQFPPLMPMLFETMMWFVRKQGTGRELETVIEKAMDELQKMPPPNQGPSPEEMKAKVEMEKAQMKAQADAQTAQMKAQADAQAAQVKAQADMQVEQMRAQMQMAVEQFRAQAAAQLQMQLAAVEAANEQRMKEMELRAEAEIERMRQVTEMRRIDAEREAGLVGVVTEVARGPQA